MEVWRCVVHVIAQLMFADRRSEPARPVEPIAQIPTLSNGRIDRKALSTP